MKWAVFSFFLLTIASCSDSDLLPEIKDRGRFKNDDKSSTPTNADLSLSESGTYIKFNRSRFFLGETGTVVFTAKNALGETIPSGGLTVSFELTSTGGSEVILGATHDLGNGQYEAPFTATQAGAVALIRALVDGVAASGPEASLQVGGGDLYRSITLSPATDQAEYQIQVRLSTSNFDYSQLSSSAGDDLRFYDHEMNECPYYIEEWNSGGESLIWVKVPQANTSELKMFYQNSTLAGVSDQVATFSYAAPKELYRELSRDFSGEMGVVSFIDDNLLSFTNTSGTINTTAQRLVPQTLSNIQFGSIWATGPLNARFLTSNHGTDSIAPIALASTVMGYPMSRGSDEWDFFNPSQSTAQVSISHYDSGGNLQGSRNFTIAPGEHATHQNFDVARFGLVTSDVPILGLYYAGSNDGVVLHGAGTDLLGAIRSGSIGLFEDGTNGTIYYDNGNSTTFSGDRGETIPLSGGGSQEQGIGVRIIANQRIFAVGQADSDGSDSHAFMALEELDREYILPTQAQYMIISCAQVVQYQVFLADGSLQSSGECNPQANQVGRVSLGASSGIQYNAGTRVVGDANFYLYYEYSDQDETNLFSYKQARAWSENPPAVSIGSEQVWE